ncbi:unnamed protein product [Boreogadus saida]
MLPVEDALELYKVKKVTCSLSQGVCLLTQSQTSNLLTPSQTSTVLSEVLQNGSLLWCVSKSAQGVTVEDALELTRLKRPPLLTPSQTSTSSPRARPPPPVSSHPEQLKGEAERLGTGGLWCQDGPETEAGDQGPAAPDQRMQVVGCVASLGDLLNKTSAVCSRPGICEESCCIPQRVSGAAASW